ncbi:SUN domain-containing protein 3-like isoform X1 [Pantherophis guttatus]|uniref:SUN domain-containing protein 3-like isoform X1 n=2 Tax=Pantherophis guttatus TaxID=94885 RepID=A0A6P9B9R2_PANGU|nr:SUN domain-containing protein 3-like isoform X1 [Pantherophis guttatus]
MSERLRSSGERQRLMVMDGKRSVRRCPAQATPAFQDNPAEQGSNPRATRGSGKTQSNNWYLLNSSGGCPRTSTTSSNQMSSLYDQGEENGPGGFTREVIAGESCCSRFSSDSTASSERSMLKTICCIPSLIVYSIICFLRKLLQSCYCARNQNPMANCVRCLTFLIIALSVIYGTVYCVCQYLRLSDGLSSKELTKEYETELNELWKSQHLLEEQFHEIQGLKKDMDDMHSEIGSIRKGILQSTKQILEENDFPGEKKEMLDILNLAFKKIFEDDIQRADWAQKSIGATIDKDRTSKTYDFLHQEYCWFPFISSANPPETILEPDVNPGNCWAFSGSEGQAVIKLPEKVQLTAITVQHISKAIAFSEGITSALKDFLVYGLNDETKEEILLGTFMYNTEKELIQTFQLKNEQEKTFQHVKIKVQSNWGNPEYTCIYRVRVHGRMANINLLGKKVDEIS